MKGLLIKDMRLMKAQRNFFAMVAILAVVLSFSTQDISFIVGYLGCMMPQFVLSTISYDEFDNGYAFLFTLPISRKGYVLEKYCFGLLLCAASLALAVLLSYGVGLAKGVRDFQSTWGGCAIVFSATAVLLSILLPLHLKFGAEKARFAIIGVIGAIFVLVYAVVKIPGVFGIDMKQFASAIYALNHVALTAGALAFALCIALLSMKISTAILCRREF